MTTTADYLCQCGWGRLAVPVGSIPACPVCGFDFDLHRESVEADLPPMAGEGADALIGAAIGAMERARGVRMFVEFSDLTIRRWDDGERVATVNPAADGAQALAVLMSQAGEHREELVRLREEVRQLREEVSA